MRFWRRARPIPASPVPGLGIHFQTRRLPREEIYRCKDDTFSGPGGPNNGNALSRPDRHIDLGKRRLAPVELERDLLDLAPVERLLQRAEERLELRARQVARGAAAEEDGVGRKAVGMGFQLDFERVEKLHPWGNKAPDALYRMGQIHSRRGDVARARAYFAKVREPFPETAAARLALREDAS